MNPEGLMNPEGPMNATCPERSVGTWLAAHPDLDRRDREVLLCAAAGLTRAQILSRPETPLARAAEQRLNAWAARRRQGEPLAYLTGRKEFWGLELAVCREVLIPRPETELLVELAVDFAGTLAGPTAILELGTGSGGVAIATAHEAARRGLTVSVTATDVSPGALAVAERNGRSHGVDIHWALSDWYQHVSGPFHLILANPPYVRADDPHLRALAYEPALALVAGDHGLAALRIIAAGAPAHLHPGGWLALEHGFDQGAAARSLMESAGFEHVTTLPDLAGLERVTRGTLRRQR